MREFNKYLLESVDEASSSLGNSSKQAICSHLERGFSIERKEIPGRIEAFANAMKKILGFWANSLKTLITKQLHKNFGKKFQGQIDGNQRFVDYVKSGRRCFGVETKKTEEEIIQQKETKIERKTRALTGCQA